MVKLKRITNFIEHDLVKKIRTDLWAYEISNERDFESIAYFHLRSFLKQFPGIKISTNYMMKGIDVWKIKNGKWQPSDFIMPDIVISKRSSNKIKPLDHLIAFELKTRSPGEGSSPQFNSEKFELDFRKLNRLMKAEKIKHAYYFLVYSDKQETEEEIEEEIEKCSFSYGKARSKNMASKARLKRFKSFVFNRYVNPRTKKIVDDYKRAEIQSEGMVDRRTYYGNTESTSRVKTLERLSNPEFRNVGAGGKAGITRKRNEIAKRRHGCKYEKLSKAKKKRVDKIRKRG